MFRGITKKPETATKIVIALIWGIITLFSPAMGLEEMRKR